MTRRKRIPRPKGELERELGEQLQRLRLACQNYDDGHDFCGKDIANIIRLLVYDSPGRNGTCRGLLQQLGKRECRYVDTAGPLNPRNMTQECNLIGCRMTATGDSNNPIVSRHIPTVAMSPEKIVRVVNFKTWWSDPVYKDGKKRTLSRNDIVLAIANTDGGSHVDTELKDETYMDISRKNSFGMWINANSEEKPPDGRPEFACMRQIAHELLLSISQAYPDYAKLSKPVIPTSQK